MLDLVALIIFTIVIILLDGFLTGLSVRYYNKYVKRFMEYQLFEMNPCWQRSYGRGSFFERKIMFRLLPLLFFLAAVWFFDKYFFTFFDVFILISGFIVFFEVSLNLNHIQNLLLFRKIPTTVTGKIKFSALYSYHSAIVKYLGALVILLLAYLVTFSQFVLGGLFGLALLIFLPVIWKRKAKMNS